MENNRFFPEIHGNLGFGCMRLPLIGEEVDQEQFSQMVDAFLDAGFNYFDTAHGYLGGRSETALRAGLTSRYPRDRYLLTNKLRRKRTSARSSSSSWTPAAWSTLTFISCTPRDGGTTTILKTAVLMKLLLR